MECLRLLDDQVRDFCQHEDGSDVIITEENFEELLKNHQVAYDGAVVSKPSCAGASWSASPMETL